MAEALNHHQSIEGSEEPPELSSRERDQWESTELSDFVHIRRNYTNASSRRSSNAVGPGSTAPISLIGQLTYGVSKFWRHQVSVTVDHVACRDHLGTYHPLFTLLPIYQWQGVLASMEYGISVPNYYCQLGLSIHTLSRST